MRFFCSSVLFDASELVLQHFKSVPIATLVTFLSFLSCVVLSLRFPEVVGDDLLAVAKQVIKLKE